MLIPKRLAVDMDKSATPQQSDSASSSFTTSLDISKLLQTRASKDRRYRLSILPAHLVPRLHPLQHGYPFLIMGSRSNYIRN